MTEPKAAGPQPADIKAATAQVEKDTKERIKVIMSCPEAKGFEALASYLAYDTDTTAEDAIKALAAAKQDGDNNTAATAPDPATAYEKNRMLASNQARPDPQSQKPTPVATINTGNIYASRRQTAK